MSRKYIDRYVPLSRRAPGLGLDVLDRGVVGFGDRVHLDLVVVLVVALAIGRAAALRGHARGADFCAVSCVRRDPVTVAAMRVLPSAASALFS